MLQNGFLAQLQVDFILHQKRATPLGLGSQTVLDDSATIRDWYVAYRIGNTPMAIEVTRLFT